MWRTLTIGKDGGLVRRLIVMAAIAVFGACGGDDGGGVQAYPQEVVDNFMESCTNQPGANESYCRCAINQLQETMSYDEFQAADREISEGGDMPEELMNAVESCVDEIQN
jgi:hypothetical protein